MPAQTTNSVAKKRFNKTILKRRIFRWILSVFLVISLFLTCFSYILKTTILDSTFYRRVLNSDYFVIRVYESILEDVEQDFMAYSVPNEVVRDFLSYEDVEIICAEYSVFAEKCFVNNQEGFYSVENLPLEKARDEITNYVYSDNAGAYLQDEAVIDVLLDILIENTNQNLNFISSKHIVRTINSIIASSLLGLISNCFVLFLFFDVLFIYCLLHFFKRRLAVKVYRLVTLLFVTSAIVFIPSLLISVSTSTTFSSHTASLLDTFISVLIKASFLYSGFYSYSLTVFLLLFVLFIFCAIIVAFTRKYHKHKKTETFVQIPIEFVGVRNNQEINLHGSEKEISYDQ